MQMPPTYNGYGNQNYPNQYDNNRMGGERGYDYNKPTLDQPMMGGGYGQPDPRQGYNNYGNYKDNQLYDQIDIVKGSAKGNRPPTDPKIDKYQRPPSVPRT